ncbi:4-hydroxyacetophenone monooxygenase [Mycolicibacterium novocastrense]|uniref:flavin-containing monooxygenase n=1 Tax=Mycolicibacterium novocastrense TaxID=59813 RepID=UPI000746F7AA|nr:NAD(P)/FAD-dependent oxidoreductase [Mycolicibacterium novocastrense]KUH68918.1 4-hydroxyacetophenone monooxygenase [Mycolicibacterium novocastrense]KUH71124.1 4-hydroxyacetophenone monooxygenase [Mycolicibacterium novocastrense]KUH72233.1 4-hydroxyacetophenone monooxygenase [Mycolicibacterium novocastrense]KUH72306.1 4-hydroxyacetophenone monooxygenase [Mycolicibacterium novocastrense]
MGRLAECDALLGQPFDDPDDVIRAAVADASVPALLMSMVHMTGDMGVLDEMPGPYALIAMDLQGAMSEPDKQKVRDRAVEVIRDYRDRGCPAPFVPDAEQMRVMLNVISAGTVTEEFVDYVAADLRFTDADQCGPVLASTAQQRHDFPVVVIGCGEAGLLAGIKLKAAGVPFTIVEKRSAVGGTWLANRYPGCRVDIASQYYTYSFEPTDHWRHYYAEQPEILQYLQNVADKYGVVPHVRFDTAVTGATWDENSATWRVTVRGADGRTEELTSRAVICAVGQFSNPVIPDIKGANTFSGPSFHTADWRDDVDLKGKRVAVIGAGASGFQLVPAIADLTEHVDVYQRTPQWMAPNPMYHDVVPDGARWAMRHLPYYARWLRFVSWWPIADALDEQVRIDPHWDNGGLSCNASNHAIREMFIAWMRNFCTDEDLLEKVTPKYPPMGKRTLQDNGTWLTTLQRNDVELVTDGIAEITSHGVITVDGVHRRADVLVWATGFDVNHQLGPIDVRGLDGLALNTAWGDSAYAYLGVTVPGFPNFYCMYGPGTNGVNGASIIYNSECQMRYIMGCIDMLLAGGYDSAMPRADVCADYDRRNQERLSQMVYSHPAISSSYYKNASGGLPTLYGFRIFDYWRWTSHPDPDDYELRSSDRTAELSRP